MTKTAAAGVATAAMTKTTLAAAAQTNVYIPLSTMVAI